MACALVKLHAMHNTASIVCLFRSEMILIYIYSFILCHILNWRPDEHRVRCSKNVHNVFMDTLSVCAGCCDFLPTDFMFASTALGKRMMFFVVVCFLFTNTGHYTYLFIEMTYPNV